MKYLQSQCNHLALKVQEPPSWVLKPSDVRGIETEKVEFKCQALGTPLPKYSWVDKDGNAADNKEGVTFIPDSHSNQVFFRMEIGSKFWNTHSPPVRKTR